MTNPTIGVIAFNCLPYTRLCIESLFANCHDDYDLVVVDNGSTDDSPFYFESLQNDPRAKNHNYLYIRFNKNLGFSAGLNEIMNHTKDIGVCLCNDIIIGPDWLSNLIKPLRENKAEFVSSEILDIGHTNSVVDTFNKLVKNEHFLTSDLLDYLPTFNEVCKQNTIQDVGGAYFPAIAMKKEVFYKVGPFDEGYEKTAYEDTDYVVRLHENFIKPKIIGNSIVYHFGGVTQHYLTVTDSNSFQARNREYFMKKFNCNLDGYICSRCIFWDENGNVHPKLYSHNMGSKFHRMKE